MVFVQLRQRLPQTDSAIHMCNLARFALLEQKPWQ